MLALEVFEMAEKGDSRDRVVQCLDEGRDRSGRCEPAVAAQVC